jgi:Family of unknown function (DUF6636)
MTEKLNNPRRYAWLVALAAVAVAGCSSSAGSTAVQATSDTPAPSTSTTAPTPTSAPTVTATAAPKSTVTVTVAPPQTTAAQPTANGPASFRSPSGNINCSLSTPGGEIAARCEVVEHTWVAPPPSPDCHLNWGDRFELLQGDSAGFNCYGQEFPAVHQILAYGQTQSFGTITCESEPTGITCTDSSTGHYFRISREGYELG